VITQLEITVPKTFPLDAFCRKAKRNLVQQFDLTGSLAALKGCSYM